jgi:hypothetical protein
MMGLQGDYDPQNVFAKILRGELPCYRIREDDDTLAFLDMFPQSIGHTLIIPKKGAARNLLELEDSMIGPLFSSAKILMGILVAELQPVGVQLLQFNGGQGGQDGQLAELAAALTAFDDSIKAAGMDQEVVVLVASEFGRTLDPASGGGSDHAWGSHWWAMGGPVLGGQMLGHHFPSLVLRGADDGDPGGRGYWVPQIASDQVAGELLTWLGLPQDKLVQVLPNLANFTNRKLGFLA